MGEVYRAHDTRLDRDVALKIMKDQRAGFDHEARAAAALNHPNIVIIYDVGPDYVVMELVEGEPLSQVLRRGAMTFRDVIDTGAQIAEGLAAAHDAHIVHRDLKPDNIMIARHGVPKILDFGLAKRTAPREGDESTVTGPGTIMGTAAYMSPEQVRGLDLDWRSDIFSLGLVLYEMITGRRAFACVSAPETMAAIVKEPPSDFGSGVNPQLQSLVLRCLEKHPERRFQSARDLAFSLRSLASMQIASEMARPSDASIESLAVIPFENVGGNPDAEYLSDGITESLINSLSRIPELRVVARSRVFRYKGKEIDTVQAGRELNVRALLTGRVAQRGDSLRVQVELVEAASETQLWGERFQRSAADILDVEEEVARQIAEKLRLQLSGREQEILKRSTQNTEAYHLYLKGRYHWNRRTGAALATALEYFQQAVEADPGYALAYAGLGDGLLVLSYYDPSPAKAYAKRARAAMARALEIHPDLPEVLGSLGVLLCFMDWDWTAGLRSQQRAIELKPDYWLAHDHYGMILSALGRHEEAIREVRRGMELEPLSPVASHHFAWVAIRARLYDEAAHRCRQSLELDPNYPMGHYWIALAYSLMSRHDEAVAEAETACRMIGSRFGELELARIYAVAGRTDDARRLLAEAHRTADTGYAEPYGFAGVYASLGESDEAFRCLERAFQERTGMFSMWINGDPRLECLRGDPRMKDLLRRMGFERVAATVAH